MSAEQPRNSFRAAVLRGEKPELVVTDKAPQRHDPRAVKGMRVARTETRRSNHRGKDRHRLSSENVKARFKGKSHKAELINLSSGGAQIRCRFKPRLWDMVELNLGDGPQFEGAVRWIKDDRFGIEFAHETRIECDSKERAELLLEVIQRSFPDQKRLDAPDEEQEVAPAPVEDLGNRTQTRHPLIWKGEIHYAFDSNPVRLRNVSEGGALLEVSTFYPVGAAVMLDLGDAGQFDATVTWGDEDQIGVKFAAPFDIACLAKARPDVTPHSWQVPTFLDQAEDDSPWHTKWKRSSIAEIRTELEGFLKR